ncbi:MAG: cyclic lactone autoinducer peptide [Bacillota bacterium]|nr:cyclic lactone autoinducer peptide [Bacillota bacterium]
MKNKIKENAAKLCDKLFYSAATSTSASACTLGFYQPKEPKALSKK